MRILRHITLTIALALSALVACTGMQEPAGVSRQALDECVCVCAGTGGSSGVGGFSGAGGSSAGEGGESGDGTSGAGAMSGSAGDAGSSGAGGTAGSCSTGPLSFSVLRAGLLDGTSGSLWEQARDVAFGADGSMYVTGGTSSPDFPTTAGAYDTALASGGTGPMDWFVTAFNPAGSVVWSTYVGGTNYDLAYAVEVDTTGVYVAGRCGNGFPVTAGAHQTNFGGDNVGGLYGQQDGCVAKLSLDGSTLLWATYFGDTGLSIVRDIAIDSAHRVHVAAGPAVSSMASKVTAGAAQPTVRGTRDAFYARLSADGSAVEYGTFLGGAESSSYADANPSVRVVGGAVYFVAAEPANATNPPTTPGAYRTTTYGGAGLDLLVARYSETGLVWASYLGGTLEEAIDTHSLEVDPDGRPVVVMGTRSLDFPGGTHTGTAFDVGVAKLSEDGSSLVAATQLGGTLRDQGEGVAIDACGNVYVTGFTFSTDLPVTDGSVYPGTQSDPRSGLAAVLTPDLQTRRSVGYDGIPGEYANRSTSLGPGGEWAIVGAVWHMPTFPSTSGYDASLTGTHGAFFRVLE